MEEFAEVKKICNPMKVYVNRKDKNYKSLMRDFQNEGSLLGSDNDKEGKFYLIINEAMSPTLKKFAKSEQGDKDGN